MAWYGYITFYMSEELAREIDWSGESIYMPPDFYADRCGPGLLERTC